MEDKENGRKNVWKKKVQNAFTNDLSLYILLWVTLILDILVVVPVYATHDINEYSGSWSLASLNILMMLMFPGIIFYIYILMVLGRNLFSSTINTNKKIIFSWLILAFSSIVLVIVSLALAIDEDLIPGALFYIGFSIFILTNILGVLFVKNWKKNRSIGVGGGVVIILLTIFALPWLFAHIGVYISDIPLLKLIFVAELPADNSFNVTVHLGNHHGMDGYLISLMSVLMIYKWLASFIENRTRISYIIFFSLIQSYGLYLFIEDFTSEQLFRFFGKEILPQASFPQGDLASLIILILALVLMVLNYFILKKIGMKKITKLQ
ncbi:MAG: hypothetical protein ACTSX6_13140 [Candidatus Heimdallarchaeaceae archaeon]